jgi:twitching motility protein PilT
MAMDPALRELLERTVALEASDLHLRSGAVPKVRRSGSLEALPGEALGAEQLALMLRSAMTPEVRDSFERDLEADFALAAPGIGRFRVNAFRSRGTDGAVLRRIGENPLPLDALGMPEAVGRLALRPRGLVLVTGPTGSGKSTTLSAMVDLVNQTRAVHVLTLEDPIEVVHRDKRATVTQRELGSDTRDWSSALRAAMRQDPDVILIGELRDAETVRAALSAAETGHAVLSSMHTTDARETVLRLVEFFPAHEQPRVRAALGASLEGIVCQRLVPRADGTGRVCVVEVAVRDARFAEAVADPDKTHDLPAVLEEGSWSGMQTFDQHLLALVQDGTVDVRTATMAASNPHDFGVMLRRTGWTEGAR